MKRLATLTALLVLVGAATLIWLQVAGRETPAAPSGPEMILAVLDIGQGDSIFVKAPSGRTMLVDAGNGRSDVDKVIIPFLKQHGVASLDYLVLTHPDQDHVGGMPAVLESLPVGTFVDSAQPGITNQAYQRTLQQVQSRGVKPLRARRGRAEIDLGPGVQVQVLGPEDPLITGGESPTNENAVVLRITYGSISMLLTADVEREAQERLVGHGDSLRSQILKVAHHGSQYSTDNEFLEAVRPEIALISAGAGNSYGHPHRQLLERLERRQMRIYRTDQQGTLVVTIDGAGYRVTTEKQGG